MNANLYYAYFDVDQNGLDEDSFFEIELTKEDVLSVPKCGQADPFIKDILQVERIQKQLAQISDAQLRGVLWGYGTWDNKELSIREDNEMRILWLAVGDIREENPAWK